MSATEELRRMLDERGAEWDELVGHPVVAGTEWHDSDGYPCTALEHADDVPDGMLSVQANLTAEQAIEATLGRGECHNVENPPFIWSFTCSECGVHSITEGRRFNYCPNCGARVVDS